jgi:protein-S-isoprenylcysteine O-methyltransferase
MASSSGTAHVSHALRYNSWAPQTNHANGHSEPVPAPRQPPAFQSDLHPSNLPHGPRSLSGISLRAFVLGLACGVTLAITIQLALIRSPLWRASFFVASLTLFHFLEYYTTATYNPSAATVSAFLLTSNGAAYNTAHTCALVETVLTHSVLPYPNPIPPTVHVAVLALGFAMLIVGQCVRSTAMVQAGTNFSHTVQQQKRRGHELVTSGVYGWLRHPSYFGFWWWSLGTQVVLGNYVCFIGYAVVLWIFFGSRIESELPALNPALNRVLSTDRGRRFIGCILRGRLYTISQADVGWHSIYSLTSTIDHRLDIFRLLRRRMESKPSFAHISGIISRGL